MERKRRGGWPERTPEPGERVPMSFRVTPGFKAKLDGAAKESGRSLAQEIELRLERSLDEERHLIDALELGFGQEVAGLMLAIGYLASAGGAGILGQPLLSDSDVFRNLAESIDLLLQAIGPDARPEAWALLRKTAWAVIPVMAGMPTTERNAAIPSGAPLHAAAVAMVIADPQIAARINFGPFIPIIRKWFGDDVVARLKDRLALPEYTTSGPQEE